MVNLTIKEIGIKLRKGGRLETFPLCVYGAKSIPEKAVSSCKIDRCIAKTIFTLATNKDINSIYLGQEALEGCCPGGQAWLGYKSFLPHLKYFISTGTKEFRGGAAEYLLADPDIADRQLKSVGTITPLGEYTVIQKSELMDADDIVVRSFLCFGHSEQIRNLCSLAYFHDEKGSITTMPWGPSCASFITYPARLTENINENGLVIGPTDPTGNYWFPENYLSFGIPFDIAHRMAKDLDSSFIVKRPNIAFPTKRISITPQE